jgi:hypothetical protein
MSDEPAAVPTPRKQETPKHVRRAAREMEKAYKEAVLQMARWMAANSECAGLPDGEARRYLASSEETLAYIIMGGMLQMVPQLADDGERERFIIETVNRACAKALFGMREQLAQMGISKS